MADGDGKNGDGKDINGDDKEEGKFVTAEEFKELVTVVKDLATQSQATNETLTAVAKTVKDNTDQQQQQHQQQQQQHKKDQGPTDTDLESMSRSEFMNHIVGKFGEALDEKLEGFNEKLTEHKTDTIKDRQTRLVNEARAKFKDFDEWKDEMVVQAKKAPGMDFEDMYTLVRIKNPDKAKEMDEKYKLGEFADTDGNQGGNNNAKPPFGGGRPGSGGEEDASHDMDLKEAGEDAWEKTVGLLEGLTEEDAFQGLS